MPCPRLGWSASPGCNPMPPGCKPMPPGCKPTPPGCNPMPPGCNPTPPGCKSNSLGCKPMPAGAGVRLHMLAGRISLRGLLQGPPPPRLQRCPGAARYLSTPCLPPRPPNLAGPLGKCAAPPASHHAASVGGPTLTIASSRSPNPNTRPDSRPEPDQALGIALKLSLQGRPQLHKRETLVFGGSVLVCIATQAPHCRRPLPAAAVPCPQRHRRPVRPSPGRRFT